MKKSTSRETALYSSLVCSERKTALHTGEAAKSSLAVLSTAAELLHQLLALFKLLDKTVHGCDIHACSPCNTVLSLGIQQLGITPFLLCHREYDRLRLLQLFLGSVIIVDTFTFICSMVIVSLVFTVFYAIVYKFTSIQYYKIVNSNN